MTLVISLPLFLFKILILQKYYNLSDEQTEFQINDRTSLKQFLGLKLKDTIPDGKTKLITKYTVTTAAPHNSTETENIVDASDNRLYADSAYISKEIEEYLEAKKCESFVHEKGYRGNPLTDAQKELNNTKSKIRARVEHIFGFMTNSMNNALYMRSIGMKRIKESIGLLNLTYNFFRLEQLIRLQKVKI